MNEHHFEGQTIHEALEPTVSQGPFIRLHLPEEIREGRRMVRKAATMRKALNEAYFAEYDLELARVQVEAETDLGKANVRAYAEFIYGRDALAGLKTADMIGLTILLPTEERVAIYAAATKSPHDVH